MRRPLTLMKVPYRGGSRSRGKGEWRGGGGGEEEILVATPFDTSTLCVGNHVLLSATRVCSDST